MSDFDLERATLEFEAKNYIEARRLPEPLAAQNNPDAQCMLANIYQLGLGVDVDGVEAVRWYKQAAESGSALACNNLWCIYGTGLPGIAVDKEEARKWYDEAKRRGFVHLPHAFS